jgi:hypothetical protein
LPAIGGKEAAANDDRGKDEGEAGFFEVEVCNIGLAVFEDAKACFSRGV